MTTAEGYPDFVKVNSLALSPDARSALGTSPLTLLLYLQTRACFQTGERTKPYNHATAAAALGVKVRTVKEYFDRLVRAGLVVVRRFAHGLTFAIRLPGVPLPDLWASDSEVQESAPHSPATDSEVQESAPHEVQESAPQPSRGENPDSESTNQSAAVGGGGTMVGGPTALAPPGAAASAERFSEATLEAIRLGEERRRQPFPEGVRVAIGYALDALPVPSRWLALEDTIAVMAANPRWNQKAPGTWGEQVKKADDARRLHREHPKTDGDYWRLVVQAGEGQRMEASDREAYAIGMAKLSTLPGRGGSAASAAALDATWWGELQDFAWITAPVWERAVSEAVRTCDFRPAFSEMLGICEVAVATLEQEAWQAQAPPLPPPTPEIAGATPEERERWAREDAFIRGHLPGVLRRRQEGAYLDDWGPHPTKPGVWIRTAPADMEGIRTAQASEDAMATVPEMTVEQRRARDRRTEVAKQRAREALEAFARRRKETR